MATSMLKTRIKHKIDTASNWASSNLVPLEGELVIYKGDRPQIKVGDGSTAVESLPFIKAGSDTTIIQTITSGTEIGSISIDGVATKLYAPSTIVWSSVTGKPSTFPPSEHTHNYLPLSGGTLSGPVYTTSAFTTSAGKVTQFASAPLGGLFSNGVAFTNPATPNDVGWVRILGTGESDTVLEIATGDDGGGATAESIAVRQYDTSDAIIKEAYLLNASGNTIFPGSVTANGFIGNATSASKLATARTISLTGSVTGSGSFDGSGNLSIATTTNHTHTSLPDGTSISGHLRIGNNINGDTNYIAFYGTNGDQPGSYNHTYIGENLYGTTEASELIIFKGNDVGNGPTVPSEPGPERIRHIAATHLFQSYTSALSGSFISICDSTVPINIMGIDSLGVYVYKNLTVNGTLTGTLNGNANSASKLATARTISLTGSVTGSGSFDGSGNLRIATSTNHSHSYLPLSGGTITNGYLYINHNSWPQIGFNNANGKNRALIYQDSPGSGTVGSLFFRVYTDDTGSNFVHAYLDTSGGFHANTVYGAVWNDYAEFRQTVPHVKPGQIVTENGDGTQCITTERLQRGCNVVSDTFGFAIGETDECKTPIACAGRALVYTYENRYDFQPGEAVCSGPNGTVSRMTREEMINNPDCIVGFVSEIPEYEVWGTGNVEVDGRIWIKVK